MGGFGTNKQGGEGSPAYSRISTLGYYRTSFWHFKKLFSKFLTARLVN